MSLFIFQIPSHRKSYKNLCLTLILKEYVYLFIWCFVQFGPRLSLDSKPPTKTSHHNQKLLGISKNSRNRNFYMNDIQTKDIYSNPLQTQFNPLNRVGRRGSPQYKIGSLNKQYYTIFPRLVWIFTASVTLSQSKAFSALITLDLSLVMCAFFKISITTDHYRLLLS